jgi:ATP/maltotriose-dependent transcriptional regulator MalT
LDTATLTAMEAEAEAAMRDGSWSVVVTAQLALADAHRRLGDPERARIPLARAMTVGNHRPEAVPQMSALLYTALARIETACGRLDVAERELRTATTAAVRYYDGPIMAMTMEAWADLALRRGDAARAAELLGTAHARRGMRDHSSPDVARVTAEASAALGETAFARAYARGRATPLTDLYASLGVAPDDRG